MNTGFIESLLGQYEREARSGMIREKDKTAKEVVDRYIKYVARYIFIRSFLLYLHGFLHSDKTAPPAFALAINGI